MFCRFALLFACMALATHTTSLFCAQNDLSLAHQSQGRRGKILVVVSSESRLPLKGGAVYPTGYYLNELSVPTKRLVDAGFAVVFADPRGNPPSMDQRSDDVKYFGGDEARYREIHVFHASLTGLREPKSLRDVIAGGLDQYDALFVPGGHAPMTDLMASPEMGKILRAFHTASKPTALICHGPIALAAAVVNPFAFQTDIIAGNLTGAESLSEGWPYAGYRMTVFSTAEEQLAEPHMGGATQFYVESALQAAGGRVEVGTPWKSHVVHDRELITGQNPFSDEALASTLLQALSAK